MFDSTIDKYDVYKVETIGDAYMVASGLPIRNGDRHAREVALLSLDLLRQLQGVTVPHIPDKTIMLRIGLHSGQWAICLFILISYNVNPYNYVLLLSCIYVIILESRGIEHA